MIKKRVEKMTGVLHPLYGKPRREETKRKISEANKRGYQKGREPWNKGLTKEDDPRIMDVSKSLRGEKNYMYGKEHTREYKEYMSKIMKEKIENGEFTPPLPYGFHGMTKPEKQFEQICEDYNLPYIYNGTKGEYTIERNIPDFYNPDTGDVVEIFGRPFHDPENTWVDISYGQTEEGKMKFYNNHNVNCVIIWDDELNDINLILERLEVNR